MSVDDIVAHTDILSTPTKSRGKPLGCRSPSRADRSYRQKSRSPTKSLVEYIQLVAKQDKVNELGNETIGVSAVQSVKRKRGRPRKVKIEIPANDFPGIQSLPEELHVTQKSTITPRKRGRPPKKSITTRSNEESTALIKKETKDVTDSTSLLKKIEISDGQSQLPSNEPEVLPSGKRKRGRPPKMAKPRRGRPPKLKSSNGDEVVVKKEPNPLPQPVKARRGRPPKVRIIEKEPELTQEHTSNPPVKSPPRRRPVAPKYASDEEEESNFSDVCVHIDNVADDKEYLGSISPENNDAYEGRDGEVSVKLLDEPSTPSKATPHKGITTEHDFTSPLKKAIMSNLTEYKDTISTSSLKLGRNFIPTPLPTDAEKYKNTSEKTVSAFFDTFEGYFDQKKFLKSSQKSKNTMGMATDVTREEFALISNLFHEHLHGDTRRRLRQIQEKMFPQYWFELTQGFSLLFYGIGSKREFLEKYVFEYLVPNLVYSKIDSLGDGIKKNLVLDDHSIPCVVINGYNPTCNYRDVFKDISQALLPEELNRNETKFWGNHVLLHIQKMIELYKDEPPDIRLVVIVHNLDGPSLRKDVFQTMLSYLSLIRQVAIIASADHIYAPILWDNFKAQNFNFIFHDITNYEPLAVESSFKDVMKMSKNDAASGAEGARFVLQSLTVNSKRMYKLLVETQLSNMENNSGSGKVAGKKRGLPGLGIEFKQLLHLCAADFIASNELSLRSMLTEFIEHKMAVLSRNPGGTEHVWVPYSYSEMKKLLETFLIES